MSAAMPILEKKISRVGLHRDTLGTVVIGTVAGDIHNIGKSMVTALMAAEGFEVHDLGVDVEAQRFVDAVEEFEADILAMSALLTMTAPQQHQTIEALKLRGLRDHLKVIVGGGAITQAFADNIGADGYHPTAVGAAKLARILLK
jgi:methanogenic corrinoid protein MtbC1